jgi:hypothetical protein
LQSALDGQAVPVDPLEADPRSAGAGLASADLDGNGAIAGEREVDALYDLLDRRDGRRDRAVVVADGRGEATPAAPILDALAEISRSLALRSGAGMERAVVVLGMSDSSRAEAVALRRQAPVLFIGDVADRADVAGGLPLDTAAQRRAFVTSLRVPAEVTARVLSVLDGALAGSRRELGELARIWARAERGEAIPRRLLISGHGDGTRFFGEDQDDLRDSDLLALASAMPRAAARIETLHLAACQHGYLPRIEAFRAVMPGLVSVWGYTGFSPSGRAAQKHQRLWERQTEAPSTTGAALRRQSARGTHRGEQVSTWTRARGFEGLPIRMLSLTCSELRETRPEFTRYLAGELVVTDPRSGPVAERYQRLQEVVNHPDFGAQAPAFRAHYERERDAALRLRFFTTFVTSRFDAHYDREIAAGYAAVGLACPRFAGMSRREALAEVARFERALHLARGPIPATASSLHRLLTEGLRDLRATVVPTRWL